MSTAVIVLAFFVDPIAQDPAYHRFIDQRTIVSVPNFLNVFSNLPFAVVGTGGLLFVERRGATIVPHIRPAWLLFFIGNFLTAFGSGYYHLEPNNHTLVWDRLPMTISFMSFVAIVVGEYFSTRVAKMALIPLLLVGASSVFYWAHTEALGRGDLRAYAVVQFVPMLLIPMVVLFYRARSDLGRYVGWMIAFYIAAKVFEFYDGEVYSIGHVVSGHSVKHLFAALAPAILLYGLMRRRYHAARPDNSTE
ncbi:MAG: alkaline phytoceramidase [Gammaproteobacteria bacterium]|nr:alkaline phytoceramidase [Gammaproteobacteria bacterium]